MNRVEELARSAKAQASRRRSSRSIGQRDPSLRWPHLYDILRAKGYDKEKSARIANSRLKFRKKGRLQGLPYKQADNKRALKKLLASSALVAACYDSSCAPPPAGTGGSRKAGASASALSIKSRTMAAKMRGGASSNTSVYPVDTFKASRPSDVNPEAPGATNKAAVRGHKGQAGDQPDRRIPRQGETVDVYRDLGKGREHKRGFPDGDAFSVRHASALPGENVGLVVASTTSVILNGGRPAWSHSAKASAEVEGKRGVHGFIRGEVVKYVSPEKLAADVRSDPSWEKITYYPGAQDFFQPGTRRRFVGSDQVALVKGEFFAKSPLFVEQTTPVTAIERKMGLVASSIVFACHSAACAPPPVGTGGSAGKGGGKYSGLSQGELNEQISIYQDFPRERSKPGGEADFRELVSEHNRRVDAKKNAIFPEIKASEARGDSRPVSREEFQKLAREGQVKLDGMAQRSKPATGLDENWDTLKADSFAEVQNEWGGATINAHTGKALPQGADQYALTVKDKGVDTMSIPIGASKVEFDAAMDAAKERFRPILEREGHHLGVFRDDDVGRIDFDPVLVTPNLSDVHSIGAATRAIGGAYNFKDGNGYWPPHHDPNLD